MSALRAMERTGAFSRAMPVLLPLLAGCVQPGARLSPQGSSTAFGSPVTSPVTPPMPATPPAAVAASSLAASSVAASSVAASPGATRAILVSFDAFNESRVIGTISPARIPAIRSLFAAGRCAASAQPAFPSVTASGHAALWTGTFGDSNGITATAPLRIPASQHSILQTGNGFAAAAIRAEPIWITAATAGLSAFAHQVTQAPGPPGYPIDDGESVDAARAARLRAVSALSRPTLDVIDGYTRVLLAPQLVDRRAVQLTEPGRWRGLARTSGEQQLEFSIPLSPDSLVRGRSLVVLLRLWPASDSAQLFAAFERDIARAVRVEAHPEERSDVRGRSLARYFSAPVVLPLADGLRASMRLRLFALSAHDTSFTLYLPGMQLADANRPSLTAAYDAAVGGWVGNSAISLWESGALGRTTVDGGDGTAERRWLESAELLTRTMMEGSAWGWRTRAPRLMLDYFPLGDDTDHALWGYLDPRRPGYDAVLAQRLRAVRERMWELVDVRLAALMQLTASSPGTHLFVAGDHGMRGAWRVFHPNVALREAGLLAVDPDGRIDLSRSRAASANGYWISVNRVGRLGGIVPASQVDSVLDEVRRVLLSLRDSAGAPVVTQVIDRRDPRAHALGIGGAAGGDVYYEVAEGLEWSAALGREVVTSLDHPVGAHGFPSTTPDMHTVSCEWGAGVAPARTGVVPLTSIAPSVREWLKIPPAP